MKPPTVHTAQSRPTERHGYSRFVEKRDDSLSVTWSSEPLAESLIRELRRSWRQGERLPAEAFLNQHPELWQSPDSAIDVIYEEYCLRRTEDAEQVEQDLLRRFPQWVEPIRVMLDCHRLLQSGESPPQYPEVGDTVGDFRLLSELGQGARGHVFLATQLGLADRPVVLKITTCDGGEHLSLARLQHTNIVPLYSCIDDSNRKIRILCMPYFGRATLTEVLSSLARIPIAERTGQHLIAAIDRLQESSAASQAVGGAARQMLSHVNYVQAMCWITACLADALQFAHEHGLVHLDLKPSNVLLATDGQPMLLDFHLANAPILPNGVVPENFGGTPGYMPPEQQRALKSLQNGEPVRQAVDGHADIYALGAMLHHALGGLLPIDKDSPPLRHCNSQVSVGLSDIVGKCVAECPEERYPSAAALAEDLRRHLTDQPLICVSNRSFSERLRKWRRQRPSALRTAGILAIAIGAVAALMVGTWRQFDNHKDLAERALREARSQLQTSRNHGSVATSEPAKIDASCADAARTLQRGLEHAARLPFEDELRQQLLAELATVKRMQLIHQLHLVAEDVRVAYCADGSSTDRLKSLALKGRILWDKRKVVLSALKPAKDSEVAIDLQDIALFIARVQCNVAGVAPAQAARESLRMLDEVESLFGPSAVLEYQRQLHCRSVEATRSTIAPASVSQTAPRTAWEYCSLGRACLVSGDLPQASERLATALALDPAGRWPNFYAGMCAFRSGRYDEAVTAFSVCIGAAPGSAASYYNRGLAHAALNQPMNALRDYTRALEIDPKLATAWLNRGILHYEQQHLEQAAADLTQALNNGADRATTHYNLALVQVAADRPSAALRHLRKALECNPKHVQARKLLEAYRQRTDGHQTASN